MFIFAFFAKRSFQNHSQLFLGNSQNYKTAMLISIQMSYTNDFKENSSKTMKSIIDDGYK